MAQVLYIKNKQERYMTEDETPTENFTKVPNAFLDSHLNQITHLPELKITLAVIRKTAGFGKKTDIISYSQFEEMTGMSRPSVCDGINYALERGLVIREKVGQYWSYSIKVVATDYQSTQTTSSHRVPEVVALGYQQVVATDYPQKKRTKENIKKDKTTTSVVAAPPLENDFAVVELYEQKQPEPQPEQLPMSSSRLVEAVNPGPTSKDRAGLSLHIPPEPQLDLAQEVKGFGAEGGERDISSSEKSKPKAKKQPRKVPIYPDDPPVIVLYKQKTNYEPNSYQTGELVKKALDLDRLGETLDFWMGSGYKANNVRGVLDRYSKGVPVYDLRTGTAAGRNDRGTSMGRPGSARAVTAHPAAADPEYFKRPENANASWGEVLR